MTCTRHRMLTEATPNMFPAPAAAPTLTVRQTVQTPLAMASRSYVMTSARCRQTGNCRPATMTSVRRWCRLTWRWRGGHSTITTSCTRHSATRVPWSDAWTGRATWRANYNGTTPTRRCVWTAPLTEAPSSSVQCRRACRPRRPCHLAAPRPPPPPCRLAWCQRRRLVDHHPSPRPCRPVGCPEPCPRQLTRTTWRRRPCRHEAVAAPRRPSERHLSHPDVAPASRLLPWRPTRRRRQSPCRLPRPSYGREQRLDDPSHRRPRSP